MTESAMEYVSGFVVPVPHAKRDAYLKMAADAAVIFREQGAIRVVECWGADVPEGKTTDFMRAVKAEADEAIVFAWIVWPSKAVADAAFAAVQDDARMKAWTEMPFDGRRLIHGGFDVVFDTGA